MKCIAPQLRRRDDYCPACSGSGQSPPLLNANGENAWKIGIIKASDPNNAWLSNNEYCGAYFRQRNNLQAIIDACKTNKIKGTVREFSAIRLTRSALNAPARRVLNAYAHRQRV